MSETVHIEKTIYAPYDDNVDIFSLLLMVWRQKLIIIIMVVLGIISAFILLSVTPPRYTAKAHILVAFDGNSLSPEYILSLKKPSQIFDLGSVLTELEILKSRKLAGRVVKRLGLVSDFVQNQKEEPQYGFKKVSVDGTYLQTLPPEAIDPDVSKTVTYFLSNLNVNSIPGTLAVKISFTSPRPQKSALIVNTLIDEYINLKIEQKNEMQERIASWLDERLGKLRANLYMIETKIEDYKKEYNLVADKADEIAITKEAATLSLQYTDTKQILNTLKSQLDLMSQENTEDILAALNSQYLNTTLTRQLLSDKFKSETKVNNLSERYGPKHPEIISARSELNEIEMNINNEFEKARTILRSEIKKNQGNLKEIEKNLETKQKMEQPDGNVLAKLNNMEREADASRMVLKTFLENYNRSLGQRELEDSDVEIISDANIPFEPSYPNKILIFALSIIASLIMGIFIAVILEKTQFSDNSDS